MLQPQPETKKFDLRWRFEFSDHKPAKYGIWSSPGPKGDLTSKPSFVNQTNLLYAVVEGKCTKTKEIFRLLEVPAREFKEFAWMASASCPAFFKGDIKPIHRLMGLVVKTHKKTITLLGDGSVWEKDA